MVFNLDSKADQFVYDENYNYINNCPRVDIDPIVVKKVHEEFEVNTSNVYGKFNKLLDDLTKAISDKVKEKNFDETAFDESDFSDAFDTFKTNALELVKENFDAFAKGSVSQTSATGEGWTFGPNLNDTFELVPAVAKEEEEEEEEEQQQQQEP